MNLHLVVGAQVLVVAALVSACGDSGDGAGGATSGTSNVTSATSGSSATSSGSSGLMGSCYGPMTHVCTMGDSTPSADQCTAAGETAAPTCPIKDLIGCCTVKAGGFTGENCYYPGSGIDEVGGKANCKQQGGTWTSTP